MNNFNDQTEWIEALAGGLAGRPVNGDDRVDIGGTTCTWCEKTHDDPVRVGHIHLGTVARSLGPGAASADCATVNQRARQLGLPSY